MMILLAEDSLVSRAALMQILRAEPSWQVMEAQDGEAAWDILNSGFQPDLCILDIRMPRLNGNELLERMRRDPRFRSTRVVVISAVRTREVIVSLGALGVLGYLLKPFVPSRVLDTIRQALGVNKAVASDSQPPSGSAEPAGDETAQPDTVSTARNPS